MTTFTPDVGTIFYATAVPQERVHEDRLSGTVTVTKHRDRSYGGAVFECRALDNKMILARARHYEHSYTPDKIYKFLRQEWTFEPVGPEVAALLRTTKEWQEFATQQ